VIAFAKKKRKMPKGEEEGKRAFDGLSVRTRPRHSLKEKKQNGLRCLFRRENKGSYYIIGNKDKKDRDELVARSIPGLDTLKVEQ